MRIHRSMFQLLSAFLIATLLTAGGVRTARSDAWQDDPPATMVSEDDDIQSKDRVSLTINAGVPSVAWAGNVSPYGVYVAQQSGEVWAVTQIPTELSAWAPDLASGNGQTVAAWMQGTNHLNLSIERSLLVQEIGGSRQAIAEDVFGEGLPNLAADANGFHLVYAATPTKVGTTISPDLLHTYRAFEASTWPSATTVVTHGTVIADDALRGGVENARIAAADNAIHIVWEQTQMRQIQSPPYVQIDHSVWHIQGSQNGAQIAWAQPNRVSPPEQRLAVRPGVAVGEDGRAHVVWTELIGSRDTPDEQHIFYRAVGEDNTVRLNALPIKVNGRFPSKATSAITIHGELACIACHGYEEAPGATTMENITLRCSHNAGSAWDTPIDVSQSDDLISIFPAIELDNEGRVHVTWAEYELAVTTFVPHGIFYRSGTVEEPAVVFLPLVTKNG